jgi:leader peptidase (prepilin peptidase)/N-methyltransferase
VNYTIFQDLTLFTQPVPFTILMGVVGLLVGSFLNVVIYRLPIMMQRQWRSDCLEYLKLENSEQVETFNLALPKSTCPHCKTPILARYNIPIFSYLWLGGKCATCKNPISARYPIVELLTAILSIMVAWHFGFSQQAAAGLVLTWTLIALSGIDLDHQLLPDVIIFPMLWLGLILSLFNSFTDSQTSIIGAAAGYLLLWSVYHGFKAFTGKEGMGQGDFKLLAMLGAWLGWQYLGLIILLSSLVGATLGLTLISLNKQQRETPIPFGPYLAVAGFIAMLWGDRLNTLYFG